MNVRDNVYALAKHKSPLSKGSALANDHNPSNYHISIRDFPVVAIAFVRFDSFRRGEEWFARVTRGRNIAQNYKSMNDTRKDGWESDVVRARKHEKHESGVMTAMSAVFRAGISLTNGDGDGWAISMRWRAMMMKE